MNKHSKIINSNTLKEFPTLEDMLKNKSAKKSSKKKKNFKKQRDFWSQEYERRENNGEQI